MRPLARGAASTLLALALAAGGALLTLLACGPGPAPAPRGDGAGRIALEPDAAVAVESPGAWTVRYEAAGDGIATGGALALHVWPEWGWTGPQIDDPDAPGYVDVRVLSGDARLEREAVSSPGTLHEAIRLRVVEGRLQPGDRVAIDYRNATTGTFSGAEQGFALASDADGDGAFAWVAPGATLTLLPGQPTHLWVVAPSAASPGETVDARASLLDRWGNLIHTRRATGGIPVVHARDEETQLSGISGRIWPREEGDLRVYWGDLHGHAGFSDGVGAPEDWFRYARDVAGLDFAALTEHDAIGPFRMDEARWSRLVEIAEAAHEPERFVTFFGYEYTNWDTGHLTVLSPSDALPLRSSADPRWDRVEELWASLAALPDGTVLTIPHHSGGSSMPTDWSHFDPRFVRTVEIFSVHGSSECFTCPVRLPNPRKGSFVLDALRRGHRLAFIGSGDTHNGHPGRAPRLRPHRTGVAGLWARAHTREALWEALALGRSFATTGARIVPQLVREDGVLALRVRAASRIAKVEILKNGRVVFAREPFAIEARETWRDPEPASPGDFYYLRVTETDGQMAWTSPIYVP